MSLVLKKILLFFLLFFFTSCGLNPSKNKNNKCKDINKLDVLANQIMKKEYIRAEMLPRKETFIVEDSIFRTGKVYYDTIGNEIKVSKKDFLKGKDVNKIIFSNYQINSDTTQIKLEVDFVASYINNNVEQRDLYSKESKFTFQFDSEKCKWISLDSASEFIQ